MHAWLLVFEDSSFVLQNASNVRRNSDLVVSTKVDPILETVMIICFILHTTLQQLSMLWLSAALLSTVHTEWAYYVVVSLDGAPLIFLPPSVAMLYVGLLSRRLGDEHMVCVSGSVCLLAMQWKMLCFETYVGDKKQLA